MRALLLLLLVAISHAWQSPSALTSSSLSLRSRNAAATPANMKHPAYFERVQRAENGRLRLCVFRSNNHIYGQVIDDAKDAVLVASSTMEKDLKETYGGNCAAAATVGKRLGERALAKGITKVHFDRNGKPYHGRIKALADGAREAGLDF